MFKKQQKQTERFVSTEIKQNKMSNEDYQKIKTFFIVLVIVIALLGLLFYFNGKVITKDIFSDSTTAQTTEPTFSKDIILATDVFNQKDKEYMVLIYDSSDKESGILYDGLFNSYSKDSVLYGVDLSNKMNKDHYNADLETELTKPTKASELVVKGPRLLTIKEGVVIDYISDANIIVEKLKSK